MSFIINGVKSIGSALAAAPSVLGQGVLRVASTTGSGIAYVARVPVRLVSATGSGIAQVGRYALNTGYETASEMHGVGQEAYQRAVRKTPALRDATIEGAKDTFKAAVSASANLLHSAKESAISRSVKNDGELLYRIAVVAQKISDDIQAKKPVSQANRNELAEKLEEFLEIYISEAKQKDRNFEGNARRFFNDLCAHLRDSSRNFGTEQLPEMQVLSKCLKPYIEKHSAYITPKLQERDLLLQVPGLTTEALVKPTNAQTMQGIKDQLAQLKSNSIKLVAGSILINMALGISTVKEINFQNLGINCAALGIKYPNDETNLVNFLIKVSNKMKIKGKTSEEVFQMLINRVIDNSGKSRFVRTQAKIQCRFLYKLISSYIGNLLNNMTTTLVDFAKLSPAEQLKEITELLVNPVAAHLNDIENPPLAKEQDTAELLRLLWAKLMGTGPQTSSELLDKFIESFLDQFLDPLHQPWLRPAHSFCLEKAAQSTNSAQAVYTILAKILWVVGQALSPIQWTLNETIHFLLRKIVVRICPSLSNATKDSLEIGTNHAWFSVKSNLLLTLQQTRLYGLLPGLEDPTFQPPKEIPAAVTQQWKTLLDKLFIELAKPSDGKGPANLEAAAYAELAGIIQDEATNKLKKPFTSDAASVEREKALEARLMTFLEQHKESLVPALQQNMNTPLLGFLKDIIKTAVADLALDMFAQDGYINETLLSSLISTNANSFAPNYVAIPEEEKLRVDAELQEELGRLSENILQAVSEGTRTDKAEQTAANVIITTLKQEIQAFQKTVADLDNNPDLSFRSHAQEACMRFAQFINKLKEKTAATVDASTQALLLPHVNEALAMVEEISGSFSQKNPFEYLRQQAEEKLEELAAYLEDPLNSEDEILAILTELRALNNPLLDLDAFESDLDKHLETYAARLLEPKANEQHPRARTKPLLALIAVYQDEVSQNAKAKFKEYNRNLTLDLTQVFAQWAAQLNFVKAAAKPGTQDAAFAFLFSSPTVNSLASSAIQSYAKKLFAFIGKEDHLAGIIKNGMKTYIDKSALIAQQKREHRKAVK